MYSRVKHDDDDVDDDGDGDDDGDDDDGDDDDGDDDDDDDDDDHHHHAGIVSRQSIQPNWINCRCSDYITITVGALLTNFHDCAFRHSHGQIVCHAQDGKVGPSRTLAHFP